MGPGSDKVPFSVCFFVIPDFFYRAFRRFIFSNCQSERRMALRRWGEVWRPRNINSVRPPMWTTFTGPRGSWQPWPPSLNPPLEFLVGGPKNKRIPPDLSLNRHKTVYIFLFNSSWKEKIESWWLVVVQPAQKWQLNWQWSTQRSKWPSFTAGKTSSMTTSLKSSRKSWRVSWSGSKWT